MNIQYKPIDMPCDMNKVIENIDQSIKEELFEIQEKAYEESRWQEPEALPLNTDNLEFAAYWLHKTVHPIIKPWASSNQKEHFEKFRTSAQSFKHPEFNVEKTYRLSAVGDLMFAKYLEQSKDVLYSAVEELIFGADCCYANLESTLTPTTSRGFRVDKLGDTPHINITKDQYKTLVKHKSYQYDIVQLANNHIMDCGEEGARITMQQLEEDGIEYIGLYDNEVASNAVKTTMINDIKVAWIAHTYSLNEKPLPDQKTWMCDVTRFHDESKLDMTRIKTQILQARAANCDLVVLTLHWGYEYEFYPHPKQQAWAYEFSELGVDMIIGHHPHVCQFHENYTPVNYPEKVVPIFYSLGNLTPGYGAASTVLSLIANIDLCVGKFRGKRKVMITGYELTPSGFMMVERENQKMAMIVPLLGINDSDLDDETRGYVEVMNKYATLILGETWKKDRLDLIK